MYDVLLARQETRHLFSQPRELKFKWMNILGLKDVPHARAKLCPLHFPPDKVFFDGSRMALLEGAV